MTEMLAMAARAAAKTHSEWHGSTFIHPLALATLIGLAIWMFLAPRRHAIFPFLILICFIPSAQRIVIGGADFTLLRLMAIAGMARILSRNEFSSIRFNRIDKVYVAWVLVGSIVYVVQQAQVSAAVYVAGTSLDMLGAYFVARVFIQTMDDFRAFAKGVAFIAIPVGAFFAFEWATQRNLFAFFGGVREITAIREGRLRCMGAFSHPITAGVFWAAVGALAMGGAMARQAKPTDRFIFALGTLASALIVGSTASSTPLLGLIAGVVFWLWWPVRGLMRYTFIAAPFVLTALHMVMQAPVWHLVSRVSAVGGSTGYHRYVLIDNAIRRFGEWWLVGTPSTIHWSNSFQMFDITNQYVFEGVRGGFLRLALFVALIYLVGRAIATAQGRTTNKADLLLLWSLGASLFVHCVSFIGVSYFGQIQYLWYMTLAIGASAYAPEFFREQKRVPRPAAAAATVRRPASGWPNRRPGEAPQ